MAPEMPAEMFMISISDLVLKKFIATVKLEKNEETPILALGMSTALIILAFGATPTLFPQMRPEH